MKNLIAAVLLLSCGLVQAATITIDFEDPSLPNPGGPEGFVTQGFEFTFGPDPIPFENAFYTGGRVAFCPGCDMYMENANGDVFSLYSFEGQGFPQPDDVTIEITGFLAGGGTLFEVVPLTGDLQLFELNWDGLFRVEFNPTDSVDLGSFPTIIDTVVVSGVPIPAAVWLFGSGLGLLGWMRRKVSQ